MPTSTIKYFTYDREEDSEAYRLKILSLLKNIGEPIRDLANLMEEKLPDGPEKSAGMRKLLEARDCFVRSGM